jgi:hypothetical protein
MSSVLITCWTTWKTGSAPHGTLRIGYPRPAGQLRADEIEYRKLRNQMNGSAGGNSAAGSNQFENLTC